VSQREYEQCYIDSSAASSDRSNIRIEQLWIYFAREKVTLECRLRRDHSMDVQVR
jgi:hypothetical protein